MNLTTAVVIGVAIVVFVVVATVVRRRSPAPQASEVEAPPPKKSRPKNPRDGEMPPPGPIESKTRLAPTAEMDPLPLPDEDEDEPLGLMKDSEWGTTERVDKHEIRRRLTAASADIQEACFIVLAGEQVGRTHLLRERGTIGRDPDCADIWLRDPGVSKEHASYEVKGNRVTLKDLGSVNGLFIAGERVNEVELANGDKIAVGGNTILKLTFQDQLDGEFQRTMYELSTRDQLTGALNKAAFIDQMSGELAFAARNHTNFCLVMFDIDYFKQINDEHGHLAGDAVLKELGQIVRRSIRREAMFVRYGGEEFIVAERSMTLDQGAVLAERIRRNVEKHDFDTGSATIDVRVSVGVADLQSLNVLTLENLIASADDALYEAKRSGRNRVVLFNTSMSSASEVADDA